MFPEKAQLYVGKKHPITTYLDPKLVLFVNAATKQEILHVLIDAVEATGKLQNKELFAQGIFSREKMSSTGIGLGVAIPHAKLKGFDTFFIAIAVHTKGVEWDSLDGLHVRLILMIGGPDDQQNEYLQLLSHLTFAIKDEERRKKILQSRSVPEIISFFEGV